MKWWCFLWFRSSQLFFPHWQEAESPTVLWLDFFALTLPSYCCTQGNNGFKSSSSTFLILLAMTAAEQRRRQSKKKKKKPEPHRKKKKKKRRGVRFTSTRVAKLLQYQTLRGLREGRKETPGGGSCDGRAKSSHASGNKTASPKDAPVSNASRVNHAYGSQQRTFGRVGGTGWDPGGTQ